MLHNYIRLLLSIVIQLLPFKKLRDQNTEIDNQRVRRQFDKFLFQLTTSPKSLMNKRLIWLSFMISLRKLEVHHSRTIRCTCICIYDGISVWQCILVIKELCGNWDESHITFYYYISLKCVFLVYFTHIVTYDMIFFLR